MGRWVRFPSSPLQAGGRTFVWQGEREGAGARSAQKPAHALCFTPNTQQTTQTTGSESGRMATYVAPTLEPYAHWPAHASRVHAILPLPGVRAGRTRA